MGLEYRIVGTRVRGDSDNEWHGKTMVHGYRNTRGIPSNISHHKRLYIVWQKLPVHFKIGSREDF